MANRYVLLKNDGEGPKPCAFYSSSLGCRNGAECKFLHGDQPTAASTTALQPKQPPEQTPQPKVDISPAPQLIPREDHPTDSSSKTSLMTPMPTKKPRKKARRKQESVDTPVATSVTSTLTSPQSQPNGKPLKPTVPTTADASLAISEDKERASREKALRKAVAAAARAQAKAAEAAKALEEAQAKAGVAGTSVAVDTPKPGDLAVAGSKSKAFQTPAANIPSERMQLAKTGGEKVINGQGNAVRKATTSDQILNSGAPVTDELPGLESEASSKKKKKRKKKDMQAPDTAAFPAGDANGMNTPAAPAAAAPAATASAPPTSGGAAAGEKVCSYFTKKKGCKSGELCTFLHDEKRHQGHGVAKGSAATPPNETKVAKSPQASSNSAPRTQPSRVEPNGRGGEQAVKKRKTKSISRSVAPVADQPVAPVEARADSGSSASSAVALVPATSPSPVPVSSPVQGTRARDGDDRSKRKRSRSKASNGSGDGFLDGLPVSPFVQAPTKPSSQAARQVKNRPPAQAAAAPAAPPEIPHLKADPWEVSRDLARPSAGYCSGLLPDSSLATEEEAASCSCAYILLHGDLMYLERASFERIVADLCSRRVAISSMIHLEGSSEQSFDRCAWSVVQRLCSSRKRFPRLE